MINAKKKGNKGEHEFSYWLMENGIKAFRNSMSGGSIWKGDIANDLDLTIEVKTCKAINMQKCWRQVERDASIAHNSPLLAVHFDKMHYVQRRTASFDSLMEERRRRDDPRV